MSLILDGTNGVTYPNATVQASAGKVLQVVNAQYSTAASSSSNVMADTGLTATITPRFATSTILVLVHQVGLAKTTGNTGLNIQLVRGASTVLSAIENFTGYTTNSNTIYFGGTGMTYLDSPATTSATTYKTQFSSGSNIALVQVNSGANSSITLLEIGA
jgi:hypothetical protein